MKKGFTLVEFIVIISIFAIMASVALFNFQGFRSNVALENLAQDIALTIRQAQVFGWSTQTIGNVQNISGNDSQQKNGIFFAYDTNTNLFGQEFVLYEKQDLVGGYAAGAYDPTGSSADRVVDTIRIQGTSYIAGIYYAEKKIDLTTLDPVTNLPISGAQPIQNNVSIAFSRPRPEARFFEDKIPLTIIDPTARYLGIYVRATNDADDTRVRIITISQFGEIDVQ